MHFGIIAAGEGSRLAGEGITIPKPLLPVCATPMVERLIRIFERAGAESVSVVVSSRMPQVRDFIETLGRSLAIPLNVRVKATPSSMHTFFELASMLPKRERFIATTVDTIFKEKDFMAYVDAFRNAPSDVDGMMAVTDYIEDEKPLYVEVGEEMEITGFKDTAGRDCRYVSGGIYGLDGRALDVLEQCMPSGVNRMRNYQRELLKAGLRLKAFPLGKIIDVDHAGDISRAEEFLNCNA